MGRSGNRALLAGTLLFVVGLFAGFGGAGLFSAPPPGEHEAQRPAVSPPRSPAPPGADTTDLASALVELRITLDALRDFLARTAFPPEAAESRRAPVGEDPSRVGPSDLAASMRALAEAIRSLPAGRGESGKAPALVAPAWVDRRAAFATEGLRELHRAGDDGKAFDAAVRAFRNEHLFWSKQEILSRYGKPDLIEVNEGYTFWWYDLKDAEGQEQICFHFSDGAVVGTDYSYDSAD